jgi:hypothetical protein
VIFDSLGEKVPFHLYRRLGLRRVIAGKPHHPAPVAGTSLASLAEPAADGADGLGQSAAGR